MDTSIYIALSRQLLQFDDMAMTSNNIANINTPGYNAQRMVFNQYLVDNGHTGKKDAYADAPTSYRDTSNGATKTTNNPLDLAISGNAYFQVETPLGTRFTKAGNFQLDANGMMVNSDGYPVLGADGAPVSLPPSTKKIEINGAGQILADGNGVGQVGVMAFENEQSMKRLGNSLYSSEEEPQVSQTARVVQGAIESSNVNGVTELVRVMQLSRSVGNTSKFIETMYDLERKSSTTLAQKKQA
jgi:flagellar basal-body rod protein FlgF